MTAPDDRASSRWTRLRTSAFSADQHPLRLIDDPKILARYQASRVMIALLGGLVGTVGLSISLSSSGTWSVGTDTNTIGVMGVIGMTVAVLLVLYPWWQAVRWLVTAALVLAPAVLMDVPITWRIGLGAVGVVVSFVIATVVFFATRVVTHLPGLVRSGMASLLFVSVVVGVVAASEGRADAQVATCSGTELTIRGEFDRQSWDGSNGDEVLTVDLTDSSARYVVEAESDIAAGSIVVQLVHSQPVPIITPGSSVTIWADDLLPDDSGSRLEPTAIAFRRDDSGIRFLAPQTDVDLRIDAGEGLYRATVTDAITGDVCTIDLRIRILASPLDREWGWLVTGGIAAIFGGVAGATHGGDPLSPLLRRIPRKDRPTSSPASDQHKEDSTSESRAHAGTLVPDWIHVRITLRLGEDDHDPQNLTLRDASLGRMVAFGAAGSIGDRWLVPIEFRRDPRNLDVDAAALLSIDILANDEPWGTVELSDRSITATGPFEIATLASGTIDLDATEADQPAAANPQPANPQNDVVPQEADR